MDAFNDAPSGAAAAPPVLELRGVAKSFGALRAVDHLELSVQKGEIFGFLGPNGAGKTTSIRMICGALAPDSGEILLDGERVNGPGDSRRRRRLGVCPQETVLWSLLTCREQLIFAARLYDLPTARASQNADELLEKLGLAEKRNRRAETLSGGMKRRLNIAMALVHDPDIVVLDEPEAGLDPQSRVLARDFIRSLTPQKTVIFTSHNMDEVERLCRRAAIIDHGKLLALDTVDHLKQSAGDGDIIDISLLRPPTDPEKLQQLLKERIGDAFRSLSFANSRLTSRLTDAPARLPILLDTLREQQLPFTDIAFRPNTLEDVFIKLTGRSLRQ